MQALATLDQKETLALVVLPDPLAPQDPPLRRWSVTMAQ